MKYVFIFLFFVLSSRTVVANTALDTLPYYEMPDFPEKNTSENVVARMIDGLGFRYYWATEGLRPQDLSFKASANARTTEETMDHILQLSIVIVNSIDKNFGAIEGSKLNTFHEKRRATLVNFKKASNLLKHGSIKLDDCKVVFNKKEPTKTLPFWNLINGPIEDAVWHTGQIISFRRSSGNPFNAKANVLTGKVGQ
ncbi:MAG: hypothetical protein QM535_12950 [Limnohabitans sp.]|nr:hypothetical protein [Limnohabitans sp.]